MAETLIKELSTSDWRHQVEWGLWLGSYRTPRNGADTVGPALRKSADCMVLRLEKRNLELIGNTKETSREMVFPRWVRQVGNATAEELREPPST